VLLSCLLAPKSRIYSDFSSAKTFASLEIAPGIKLLHLGGKGQIFGNHMSRNGNIRLAWKSMLRRTNSFEKWLGGWFGLFIIKRGMYDSKNFSLSGPQRFGLVLLSPFQVYPFVGLAVTAWFKALGTSHLLRR